MLIAYAWALLLAGCATLPTSTVDQTPIFYPPEPAEPRIQFLTSFGSTESLSKQSSFSSFVLGKEEAAGKIGNPYGLAFSDGKLYVCDTVRRAVLVINVATRSLGVIGKPGQPKNPIHLCVDADGTKYIADTSGARIWIADRSDRITGSFGQDKEIWPVCLALWQDRLYVCNAKPLQILVLDKKTGTRLLEFGKAGDGPSDFQRPTHMAADTEGNLYVSDSDKCQVLKFDKEGRFVRVYGRRGDISGSFARPKGIAVDRQGIIYVADAAFEKIQLFNNAGRLLMFFGEPYLTRAPVNLPSGLGISYEGIDLFSKYIASDFEVEYLLFLANQSGTDMINVYGFGHRRGQPSPPAAGSPSATTAPGPTGTPDAAGNR